MSGPRTEIELVVETENCSDVQDEIRQWSWDGQDDWVMTPYVANGYDIMVKDCELFFQSESVE